jgi:hypothetical protein
MFFSPNWIRHLPGYQQIRGSSRVRGTFFFVLSHNTSGICLVHGSIHMRANRWKGIDPRMRHMQDCRGRRPLFSGIPGVPKCLGTFCFAYILAWISGKILTFFKRCAIESSTKMSRQVSTNMFWWFFPYSKWSTTFSCYFPPYLK